MAKISLRRPITVIVTLEGLAATSLGCYGCSWNETPSIDALASNGIVWDRWIGTSDVAQGQIRTWLETSQEAIKRYRDEGRTVWVSDDDSVREHVHSGFDSIVQVPLQSGNGVATSNDRTALASTFAAAIDQVDATTRLVWLHSRALMSIWDAPKQVFDRFELLEPQEETFDDDEPVAEPEPYELPDDVQPPRYQLTPADHPDLLFTWMQRYAEVVAAADELIGAFADATSKRQPTFVIAAASGFALGENGWLGHRVGPLRSCDVRLPMIVSRQGPLRVPAVVSAVNFGEVLRGIVSEESPVSPEMWCDPQDAMYPRVITTSDRAGSAVTTPSWFYVQDLGDFGEEKLFLKPDDVCDVNDVSRLRLEIVDELSSAND